MVGKYCATWVCVAPVPTRRAILTAALGLGLDLSLRHVAAAPDGDPRSARPQEDDQLVFLSGEKEGQIITPADLSIGGPPVMAYPMEPHTRVVRDGSRLNQLLLLRFSPEALAAATRPYAAEGMVAYSAICTHTGCPVTGWQNDTQTLQCPCHNSAFDPKDTAQVLKGPAPRRLAILPLKVVDGVLLVAGVFAGRVGFTPQ
jgi:rieske iron-sulfur protein